MKTFLTIALLGLMSLCFAQTDTITNKLLKEKYYENVDFLIRNKQDILKSSRFKNNEVKDVLILTKNKYEFLTKIKDTVERKRLMAEEMRDLEIFKDNYNNKAVVAEFFQTGYKDVDFYRANLDSLKKTAGLEPCVKCAFSRKVKFITLKAEKNRIDTLKCVPIKYIKLGFQNTQLSYTEFNSFPCDEIRQLSLNGGYGKNIIEINYEEKLYRREFTVTAGKSENDIYMLPIVLDKKYLVYDK